jgi:hypothetical protein
VVEAGKAVWSFVAQNEEECASLADVMTKLIDDILRKKYLEDQGIFFCFLVFLQ